jgi:LysM repeat protein
MVRSGDTLSGIARTYGVSINAIKDANNLRTDIIQIGQRLLVPSIGSSTPGPVPEDPVPTVPSGQVTHVIKAGETLTSIALQYGVSSQMLADMNNIVNPNALKIGQALIVKPAPIVEDATPADGGNNADSLEEIFRNAGEAPVVPLPPRNE